MSPDDQASRKRKTLSISLILGISAFGVMASLRVCDALVPALAADFNVSIGQAARSISAFAVSYGFLQIFYGPLGDRFGKLRVVGFATLACTLGCMAAALSHGMSALVASRMLWGATAAGVVPLTMAWIGDTVAYDKRQDALARLLSFTMLGMISGQWLGGLVADAFGWRTVFALLAIPFAFAGVSLVMQGSRHDPPRTVHVGGPIGRLREVVGVPWARRVLITVAAEGALVFGVLAFIPSHLHHRFGLSIPLSGGIAALYGVGGLTYSRCAPRLLRRLGESGLAKLGGSCMAIAFLALALTPTWMLALPACFMAGFGFYSLHTTLQTHATQMVPAVRGTAVSLFSCALFSGQSVGVAAMAYAVDLGSSVWPFSAAAVGIVLLGFVFAAMSAQRHDPALGSGA